MRHFTTIALLLAFGKMAAQAPQLQLAPPQTPSTRLFSAPGQAVAFDFRLAGAEIRYTTDGSEPTTASATYSAPVSTNGWSTLKARSFKAGFLPSETTTVQLVQPGSVPVDSVATAPAPKKYVADGWRTLCDGQLGADNFHQHWLGFDGREVEIQVFFKKKRRVSQVSIGYLRHQGSWIFGPAQVIVSDESGRVLASQTLEDAATELPPTQSFLTLRLPKGKHKKLTIKLLSIPALPDWHPGKGNLGWLFLDEVLVW